MPLYTVSMWSGVLSDCVVCLSADGWLNGHKAKNGRDVSSRLP